MTSIVRKLIIILSMSIFLQPVIKGQYIVYDEGINDNVDLPVLLDLNSSETVDKNLENNYFDMDLEELENQFEKRQSRNPEKTKSAHFCMAVPKRIKHFGFNKIEYKPSAVQEYDCKQFDRRTYNVKLNGGICIIPQEHCITLIKPKTFLKREKNSQWWVSDSQNISVGCKCHDIKNGF